MGYMRIEGDEKNWTRARQWEGSSDAKSSRILLRSRVQSLQLFCQREVATVNNTHWSPSYTLLITSRDTIDKQSRQC